MMNRKRVYLGGITLMALIWLFSFLTRKDALWAGQAMTWSALVMLAVALAGLVVKDGMEKS
ncbi:MAG TPA: hypothetical protein ENN60_01040 [archaeon]|nr:hypothetical protein [archaeon]